MHVEISKPQTVYVKFIGTLPNRFTMYHDKHGLYYFRDLQGKAPRIKFNLCHPGKYTSSTNFEIVKIVPIEIPENLPDFPKYDRDEIKDFTIVDNPLLQGSPARIFAKTGVIEKGKNFYKLPKPLRVFILLHEIGHFFYGVTNKDIEKAEKMSVFEGKEFLRQKRQEGEKKCDAFALIHYLQMGYNRSMAFNALSTILHRSQNNIDRVKHLLNNIQKTQTNSII